MLRNNLFKPWYVGEKDWGVEIIDGEFKDVVIQFNEFKFNEQEENRLDLDYHVIKKPNEDLDLTSLVFEKVLEQIVNDILTEAIENAKQNRDNSTEESST